MSDHRTDAAPPSDEDLRAYCRGSLDVTRFAEVDAWLEGKPAHEVEHLLSEAAGNAGAGMLSGLASVGSESGFITELARNRLQLGQVIGVGGMSTVTAANDRILGRAVALKVLRPRQPGEPLEQFHLREECFRREAAVTASLEHPGIVPIYDVGKVDGLPAFTMKQVVGRTLQEIASEGKTALSELVACLLRVADAVALAHSLGIVHRDLTPGNILIADFGAIYVLDWGLAGKVGEPSANRSGTPAWMAPEQSLGGTVDPRLDVFALGALLHLVLTGNPPRSAHETAPAAMDLGRLEENEVPTALAALARRCLEVDPDRRYPDASFVSRELRRWLDEGLTLAQSAGPVQVALQRLRRSPQTKDAVLIGLLAALCLGMMLWSQFGHGDDYDAQRIAHLEKGVLLERLDSVRLALGEVNQIRARRPQLAGAKQLAQRLEAALAVADRHEADKRLTERIGDLLVRTRIHGQWSDERADCRQLLSHAGLVLSEQSLPADEVRLREHPLRGLLVQVAAYGWRAELAAGETAAATRLSRLIATAGPTAGWQALGRLLNKTTFADREPIFCACVDSDLAIRDPDAASVVLSVYAPDERLVAYARAELATRPGAFWPLITSARAHVMAGDLHAAQHEAMIASGAEPGSRFPQMILAYVAVRQGNLPDLQEAVQRASAIDPDHDEVIALKAIWLARSGRDDDARTLVARLRTDRLRYHLEHPTNQLMGISVAALAGLGLISPVPVPVPVPVPAPAPASPGSASP